MKFLKKIFYTTIVILFACYPKDIQAQNNGGFFNKVKNALSADTEIGSYTFKDGSVYNGELRKGKPYGKGKTIFKNKDTYETEY